MGKDQSPRIGCKNGKSSDIKRERVDSGNNLTVVSSSPFRHSILSGDAWLIDLGNRGCVVFYNLSYI